MVEMSPRETDFISKAFIAHELEDSVSTRAAITLGYLPICIKDMFNAVTLEKQPLGPVVEVNNCTRSSLSNVLLLKVNVVKLPHDF